MRLQSVCEVRVSLTVERETLENVPNLLTYQTVIETEAAGYLIRQWLASNLYDRISTWPFLATVEKLWISYQLLFAMREAVARNIAHGDLKCENVLVTTALCVYVTDLASSFKPTFLPLDDPTDFSLFFETSGRRICYIAPERFYESFTDLAQRVEQQPAVTEQPYLEALGLGRPNGTITEKMDVFSLGCVLAELWRDGKPMFTLSQLYKYRSGQLGIQGTLDEITNPGIREIVQHMLERDPEARPSFSQVLADAHGTVFPAAFGDFLHLYLVDLQRPALREDIPRDSFADATCARSLEPDDRIEKLYEDWAAIFVFFGPPGKPVDRTVTLGIAIPNIDSDASLPVCDNEEDGTPLVLLDVILSNIRHCTRPSARVGALELISHLSWGWLSDDSRLDRVLPILVAMIDDTSALVRTRVVQTLVTVLVCITRVSAGNAGLVQEYLVPHMGRLADDTAPSVRCMYAGVLRDLAANALRLLLLEQVWHADARSFDTSVIHLQSFVEEQVTALLADEDGAVQRAMLDNFEQVAVFLGRHVQSCISSIAMLGTQPDWRIRASVYNAVPCIAKVVPADMIFPLVLNGLTDPNEGVLLYALRSVTAFLRCESVNREAILQLIKAAGFLCHPCVWIREASVGVAVTAAAVLPASDVWTILYPVVRSLLSNDIRELSEAAIWNNLAPPLSRDSLKKSVEDAPMKFDETVKHAVENVQSLHARQAHGPDEQSKLSALAWYINAPKVRDSVTEPDISVLEELSGTTPQTVFFSKPGPRIVHSPFLRQVAQRRVEEHARMEYPSTTSKPQRSAANPPPESEIPMKPQQQHVPKPTSAPPLAHVQAPSFVRTLSTTPAPAAMSFATAHAHYDVPDETIPPSQVFGSHGDPFSSTYEGSDSYIMAHLERVYHGGQRDMPPIITVPRLHSESNSQPHGTLIASFCEHETPITTIAVSPDHAFFVSGDASGAVKVWDTTRLEKNVASRSRVTYTQSGAINALLVLAGTHCVTSASRDGSIHVWAVVTSGRSILRYGIPRVVATAQLDGEYVMCMVQLAGNPTPQIAVGTSQGRIRIIDVRSLTTVAVLENPASHGAVTAIALDRERNWVCAGTSTGTLELWDLRFHLRIESWKVAECVTACVLHPVHPRSVIFAGPLVGIFDLAEGRIDRVLSHHGSEQSCTNALYANRFGYANEGGYVLTAGGSVRYWDLVHTELDTCLSGPVSTRCVSC